MISVAISDASVPPMPEHGLEQLVEGGQGSVYGKEAGNGMLGICHNPQKQTGPGPYLALGQG